MSTRSYDAELGTDYDRVIAERHGVSRWTVCMRRRELGVAKYDPYQHVPFGEVPDTIIAEVRGVAVQAVQGARTRRGRDRCYEQRRGRAREMG